MRCSDSHLVSLSDTNVFLFGESQHYRPFDVLVKRIFGSVWAHGNTFSLGSFNDHCDVFASEPRHHVRILDSFGTYKCFFIPGVHCTRGRNGQRSLKLMLALTRIKLRMNLKLHLRKLLLLKLIEKRKLLIRRCSLVARRQLLVLRLALSR